MNFADQDDREKYEEIKEAFQVFDKDNDGFITIKELATVMRSLGHNPTETELADMIQQYDRDGSGTIDFAEFFELMMKKMNDIKLEDELIEIFKVLDRDGNGLLSGQELQAVLALIGVTITDEEVEELIKQADINGDGYIGYDEFVKMMSAK